MRLKRRPIASVFACAAAIVCAFPTVWGSDHAQASGRSFSRGLPTDPSFFPLAVWLQNPTKAAALRAIGINTFVGLWRPPTAADLAQLESQGMNLIVEQTPEALALRDSPVIRGWLHIDEPDNAQPNGKGGYGDCISSEELIRRYDEMRSRDPTRPVYLGFGQAVANPLWPGRGAKCGAIPPAEYYTKASRGADIVDFDIYPVVETRQTGVMGRLVLVGRGVRNLRKWTPAGTPVWADIETTHINHPTRRPMPKDIYSEVWIAIICGATGINYFLHEWQPSFREDGVFRYRDAVAEITRINQQVSGLAPLLNSVSIENAVRIESSAEIAHMVKRDAHATYIFAVNMENKEAKVRISLGHFETGRTLVTDGDRRIKLDGDTFEDAFEAYAVHIYRVQGN
jgi:hypothetical protein